MLGGWARRQGGISSSPGLAASATGSRGQVGRGAKSGRKEQKGNQLSGCCHIKSKENNRAACNIVRPQIVPDSHWAESFASAALNLLN